jgi:hypothetical protein
MYFWRINSLKRDLAARAVTESAALPYLLWLGGLTTFASSFPLGEPNGWDLAIASASVVLFLTGTAYAFRSNGGAAGYDFVIRYLAINWVVGFRLVVFLVLPGATGLIALQELLFNEVPSGSTALDFGLVAAFESLFYWRVISHVRDVAVASRAA